MTQIASSIALSVLNSSKASAAVSPLSASNHEGQLAPGGSYTNGNVTTYKEGDTINFRFKITADSAGSGQMQVEFTSNDTGCLFFDGSFSILAQTNATGSPITVAKVGSATNNGADWVQVISVNTAGSGSTVFNYQLKLSDQAGECSNGSPQHSRLANKNGDSGFKNIGNQNVPIPSNQVIELPELNVIKRVDTNGDGQYDRTATAGEWKFSLDGGTPVATDANGKVVFTNVATNGNHLVTESAGPSDQTFASGSGTNCTFNGSTATANVQSGTTAQDATCIFVNTVKKGSITIVKDAIPNNAQDFTFTATGTGVAGFSLDDDSDTSLSNTKVFSNLSAGNYVFTENATAGWTFDSLSCPNATIQKNGASVTVTLSAGQNITCTFTNRKNGTITVNKVTNPVNDPTLFSITASGTNGSVLNTATQNVSTSQSVTYDITQGGTYNITENLPVGWTQTSNTCTNIAITSTNLAPTCTITNTKKSTLVIIKDALPNDAQDFSFTTTGGLEPSSFNLDDDNNATLSNTKTYSNINPGAYTVTELATSGWALTNLVCNNQVINGSTASITLAPGQTTTCVYTNTKYSTISGYKYLVNSDGTVTGSLSNWAINLILADGKTVSNTINTNSNGYYEFSGLLNGVYYLQEQNRPGYTQVVDTEICPTAKLLVNISAGQSSTHNDFCNFKNGSISGHKFNDKNGNGTKNNDEPYLNNWTIVLKKMNSDKVYDFVKSTTTNMSGEYSFSDLAPGTYSVCEVQKDGWVQTAPAYNKCFDGIVINQSGETNQGKDFGNQQLGQIKIVKMIDSTSYTNDKFNLLLDKEVVFYNAGNNSSTDYIYVKPGQHFIGEMGANQWVNLDDYVVTYSENCGYGKANVVAGEKVTCVITNHKKAKVTVEKDAIPNDRQDFEFTIKSLNKENDNNWEDSSEEDSMGLNVFERTNNDWNDDNGFILDDDNGAYGADNKYQNTKDFNNLAPGWYEVSEKSVDGWDLDGVKCDTYSHDDEWGEDNYDHEMMAGQNYSNYESYDSYSEDNEGDSDHYNDSKGKKIYIRYGDTIKCKFTNVKRAKVTIIKDAKTDSPQEFTFSQNIDKSGDFTLVDDGTDVLNEKTFDNLKVGREGKSFGVSEKQTDGWRLASIDCDYRHHDYDHDDWEWDDETNNDSFQVEELSRNSYNNNYDEDEGEGEGDYSHDEGEFDHYIKVKPGQNVECTFTNEQTVLFLNKSNNRPDATVTGDQVMYTLVVTLPEDVASLNNVVVTDLAPENFKYVAGSWTAKSSVRGDLRVLGTTTEPTYHSPGQWNVGNMIPGEVVTLTYLATILSVVSPGTYPDVAFATGMTADEGIVYDNLSTSSTPFVQTKVTVNKDVTPVVINELANTGDAVSLLNLIIPALMILLTILGFQATRWQSSKGGK